MSLLVSISSNSRCRNITSYVNKTDTSHTPGTHYCLTLDLVTLYTPLKNTSKHTCSDSLNLKPPAPPYPLQDLKAIYKCCIIIIIIIIIIRQRSTHNVKSCVEKRQHLDDCFHVLAVVDRLITRSERRRGTRL